MSALISARTISRNRFSISSIRRVTSFSTRSRSLRYAPPCLWYDFRQVGEQKPRSSFNSGRFGL